MRDPHISTNNMIAAIFPVMIILVYVLFALSSQYEGTVEDKYLLSKLKMITHFSRSGRTLPNSSNSIPGTHHSDQMQ